MIRSCKDIRDEFIRFFEERGHTVVPSSSLLPADDPTLLFTNAGMNQFKPIFLGTETRSYNRAVDTQKCIRAGGKHNDLEDVGKDCYHHTFFEMLGNWSFGDYFKAGAIDLAWELLVNVWGLDPARLHATYFEGDESEGLEPDAESRELWLKHLPPERIHPGNKKDNFWEMGETGPCGPCSEIHYDATDDFSGGTLVNAGDARVIEIWNLVFIQFNRSADGLSPLPAKHVDTGLGLERIGKILNGKMSNYATDLFLPIIQNIEELSGKEYGVRALEKSSNTKNPQSAILLCEARVRNPQLEDRYDTMDETDLVDVAIRVIADHARALTFAIADGILPGNEGRGYVLRSILRRAAGFGRQHLGIDATFLHQLVPTIVDNFADAFPNLKERQKAVTDIITDEEESFAKTLDKGISYWSSFVMYALLTAFKEQHSEKEDVSFSPWNDRGLTDEEREYFFYGQGKSLIPAGPEKVVSIVKGSGSNAVILKEYKFGSQLGELLRDWYTSPPIINGTECFNLHATYGFPFTLTKLMAEKAGLAVDETGFQAEMEKHRELSSAGAGKFKIDQIVGLPATDDSAKYERKDIDANVVGWVVGDTFIDTGELAEGTEAAVVLDATAYYGESGGQVGDCGTLIGKTVVFDVDSAQLAGQCVLHAGRVRAGTLKVGQTVTVKVCPQSRFDTMRNHSATHLLNWALRSVLGDGVDQAGSVVDPKRLRFDFTANKAVTAEQLAEVEKLVNERILADEPVEAKTMPLAEAQKISGVRAVFGEKYPDPVRVVTMGHGDSASAACSVEFCGGTHLKRTSQVGLFKILSEESVAKGIRRITAVTGHGAAEWVRNADATLRAASGLLKAAPDDIPARIEAMQNEIKKLRKRPAGGGGGAGLVDEVALDTPLGKVLVARSAVADAGAMRNLCDQQRQKGAAAVFLGAADEDDGKVLLIAMVSDELIKAGKLKAGDWVKATAPVVGGGGGGKPNLAQAGGKQPEKLPDALKAAADFAKEKLA
jgi:alanyl-tRNA synthetase